MRSLLIFLLLSLSACSVHQKSVVNSHLNSNLVTEFKAAIERFKGLSEENLSVSVRLAVEAGIAPDEINKLIKSFLDKNLSLIKEFEGMFSSGQEIENIFSLAYISMIYLNIHEALDGLKPAILEKVKADPVNFLKRGEEEITLLNKSQHALLTFLKVCIREKVVPDCNKFRQGHIDELPSTQNYKPLHPIR